MTVHQNSHDDIQSGLETGSESAEQSYGEGTPVSRPRRQNLQPLEFKAIQSRRRRKPPAWALKVIRTIAATKQFFGTTLLLKIRRRRRELITAGVSFLVHLCLGLLLAAWLIPQITTNQMLQLLGAFVVEDEFPEQPQPPDLVEIVQPESMNDLNVNSTMGNLLSKLEVGLATGQADSANSVDINLPLGDITEDIGVPLTKGEFGGRSGAGRRAAVARFGGTAESERTVNQGLVWLQKIQRGDGSWSFAEVGEAGQPGNLSTTDMGATSLALLCFLGGGHTHERPGPYQETVSNGLGYLLKNAERSASGADLRGQFQGNSGMYVQGIATICVCEASALEPKDKELRRLASDAVKFIERAQHRIEGGWRYNPGDPGDTSVVGWQLMALQCAKAARISVQSDTIRDAKEFLNSVSVNDGSEYSYMPDGGASDTMTAVGLLCRMYNGWNREKPQLKTGVEHLAARGPIRGNIYHNYYASQVLHHWGGDLWKTWNLKMREELVSTQVREGPGAGSWDVTDPHGFAGGRIYQTTLSLLTLEVYYRHLPMYREFDNKAAEANKSVSTE